MSIEDDLKQVEYELNHIQKNKATEHYIGNLKARLSKLLAADTSKKTGGKSYSVKKQGNATVVFVGFPSVGKSTLLNALTGAQSKTASYDFPRLIPIPGMLFYSKTKLQLIDAPGIIEGASKGRGGGKQILSAARNADLILILLDPLKNRLKIIHDELYAAGLRLDLTPPDVLVKRTDRGGLLVESTVEQELAPETFKSILREFGYLNAEVLLREKLSIDRFIDSLSNNRLYLPSLVVFNKADLLPSSKLKRLKRDNPATVFISAEKKQGLEELREAIWKKLDFKRIYLKHPGKEPDFEDPLIMRGYVNVKRVIKKLKKDYTSAKVWGRYAKHPGQVVSVDHELHDEDIVTLS